MVGKEIVEQWFASGKSRWWAEQKMAERGMEFDEIAIIIDAVEAEMEETKARQLRIGRISGIIMLIVGIVSNMICFFYFDNWYIASGPCIACFLLGLMGTIEPKSLSYLSKVIDQLRD